MNRLKLTTLLLLPLAVALALPVQAHSKHDGHGKYDRHSKYERHSKHERHGKHDGIKNTRFEKRLEKQDDRIRNGIKSGQLTRKEAIKLKDQQKAISMKARKFLKDGELSRSEKRKLEKKQDKASKSIYRQKHDSDWSKRRYSSLKHYYNDYQPTRKYYGYKPRRYSSRWESNHHRLGDNWFDDNYGLLFRFYD